MPRRVSCFPSADDAFCGAATLALHEISTAPVGDVASLLTTALRSAYPAVEVHRQEALARVLDEDLWYVYRDGKPRLRSAAGG
jgi:hypothetical protein